MVRMYLLVTVLGLSSVAVANEASVEWLPSGFPEPSPDGLCQRSYLTPEMGALTVDAALQRFSTEGEWEAYRETVRNGILRGAGLDPLPRRSPLNPIIHSLREYDGYSVENVAFESVPGYWVTGNLYRPLSVDGKAPAVLNTHGHTAMVERPEDWVKHGRFHEQAQLRAAALARMGAVVFSIDMFGYGDGIEALGTEAHRTSLALRMQVWNAMRTVDFLSGLPEVDRERIGVTGESGGGTQAFLLAALDERVAASAPVVMASSYFFGGCPCESGLPIHRSDDHFVSNIMIAAMAAPRPMLLVSDGGDWTVNTPLVEYPFVRSVYRLYGAEDRAENVHLADEGHDYGPSKRAAMYRFMAKTFRLNLAAIADGEGNVDESTLEKENPELMRVFGEALPLPDNALRSPDEVAAALDAAQR